MPLLLEDVDVLLGSDDELVEVEVELLDGIEVVLPVEVVEVVDD
jgi:hypothetical protein